MPAAGKSGTTTGNKDFWFAGYTPYYTCSIWLGYDDNKEMNGNHWYYHERIWSHIMDRINNALGLAYKKFEMPSSIVKRTICAKTGLLALTTDEDTEDLIGICEETITEYFAPDSVPKKTCEGHEIEPPPEPEEPEEPEEGNTTDGNGNSNNDGANGNSGDKDNNGDNGNSNNNETTPPSDTPSAQSVEE